MKTGAGQAAPGKADNKAGKKEERSVEEEEEEDGTQPAGGEAPRVGDRVKVLFTDKRYYEGKVVAPPYPASVSLLRPTNHHKRTTSKNAKTSFPLLQGK